MQTIRIKNKYVQGVRVFRLLIICLLLTVALYNYMYLRKTMVYVRHKMQTSMTRIQCFIRCEIFYRFFRNYFK